MNVGQSQKLENSYLLKVLKKLVMPGVIAVFTKLKENRSRKLPFCLIFITSEERTRKERNEK